ncbi:MAG: glycosyltransferase family 4 protein [Calditrichota bacterium]
MSKLVMVDSLVDNDYAICLCNALKEEKQDVSLVVTENRRIASEVDFVVERMAPTKERGISKLKKLGKYFQYLLQLRRYAARNDALAIHFQFFRRERLDSFYFALLRLLGYNVVHTAHNVLPHERGCIDFYLKYLVYLSASRLIVHSDYIRNKLLATFNINPSKVFVVPHGNFDMYIPDKPPTIQEARQNLELPQNATIALCFGHIREYKGIDALISAFEIAAKDNSDLYLVVAGSARTEALKKRYADQIANSAVSDRIRYRPEFIPNEAVADYLTSADIITLPYRAIDHSGIVHLAYSFGKPVLATRVGDFDEAIEHGKSGMIVDPDNVDVLAKELLDMSKSKSSLKEMGEYARMLNETKYSWQDIARKTIAVYKS